jgi:hypothetical protein
VHRRQAQVKQIMEMKERTPLDELCAGLPDAVTEMIRRVRTAARPA